MNEDGYTHELIIKTDESILPHRNEGISLEGGSLTACKNRGQVKHYSYEPHMQKVELKANLEKKNKYNTRKASHYHAQNPKAGANQNHQAHVLIPGTCQKIA